MGCQRLNLALPEKDFVFPNNTNKSTEPASPCLEIDHRPVVGGLGRVLQSKARAQNQSPGVWPSRLLPLRKGGVLGSWSSDIFCSCSHCPHPGSPGAILHSTPLLCALRCQLHPQDPRWRPRLGQTARRWRGVGDELRALFSDCPVVPLNPQYRHCSHPGRSKYTLN